VCIHTLSHKCEAINRGLGVREPERVRKVTVYICMYMHAHMHTQAHVYTRIHERACEVIARLCAREHERAHEVTSCIFMNMYI